MLSGLHPDNLIILAARPGIGKTALALNIAHHVAVKEKLPVGICSLEMSREEIIDRLLIAQADIDAWGLKTGRLTEEDSIKISTAIGILAEAPIYIDDTAGVTVHEICTKARRLKLKHDIKLLIVDYLQLIRSTGRNQNRTHDITIISQSLKVLARELKIPVLTLSQLSRDIEKRKENKSPQLSDLRDSGSIEQDADVVMFIYQPEGRTETNVQTKILVAKHRNGPIGECDLLFRGNRIKFYNI